MPKRQRYHANGAIFWSGLSRIDRKPIVAIVTGIFNPSSNPKTGVMHQTWMLRSDVHPFEAINTGEDASICGDCPLRHNPETGKRLCYVNPMTPSNVYRSYIAGKYPIVKVDAHSNIWFDLKPLRVGAYGDPAAIPVEVWTDWLDLLSALKMGSTGYTRRWMYPENQPFQKFLMASVFNDTEQQQAESMGWRTYRVLAKDVPLPANAIVCPGSEEGGYAKICRECLMCRGTSGRSNVVIQVHGYNTKFFKGG